VTFRSGLCAKKRPGVANTVSGRVLVRSAVSVTVAAALVSFPGEALAQHGSAAALSASDEAALFAAAGFSLAGNGQYQRCKEEPVTLSYQPGHVELADINGDGRAEAWVTESSLFCYGNTGQHFVLLTEAPAGWQVLLEAVGIAVIKNGSSQGWPDIEVGGPGFREYPLYRWNGDGYLRITP
jgi:hypothetical protein